MDTAPTPTDTMQTANTGLDQTKCLTCQRNPSINGSQCRSCQRNIVTRLRSYENPVLAAERAAAAKLHDESVAAVKKARQHPKPTPPHVSYCERPSAYT